MFRAVGQVIQAAELDQRSPKSQLPATAQELPAERDAATGLPVLFDRRCDREIPDSVVCGRDINGVATELRRALTPDERLLIMGRMAALKEALQPYGDARDQVEIEIAAMLSGFRAMRQQGDGAMAMIEVTCAVLREFPFWAIAKACRMIVTRRAHVDGRRLDERYAPNDTEIYAIVEDEVRLHRRAYNAAKALLDAKVLPPDPAPAARGAVIERIGPGLRRAARIEWGDGKHAERVAAELAARKARNETANEEKSDG